MRKAVLVRLEAHPEEGTFGALLLDGRYLCATLELPDRGNAPNVSSIPAGRYVCRRRQSPRFGETFEISGVPGRTHILFHAGNRPRDTQGCVLLGRGVEEADGARMLVGSRLSVAGFMDKLRGEAAFELAVVTLQV